MLSMLVLILLADGELTKMLFEYYILIGKAKHLVHF